MELDKAVAELETLVQTLEREGDERALMLLQLIDAVHRPALERLAAGDIDHPLAQALLAMYELVPADDRTQVEEALDSVRPYINSHGGEVELLDVEEGVVRLRMRGACVGCAASSMTLKRGIESALREGYPGFRELIAEDNPAEPSQAGQLLQIENARRPVFVDAAEAGELAAGEIGVSAVEGRDVLLVNVDGEVYAFLDGCPVDGGSLEGGRLTGGVLVCPWHNCAYDARSGKRLDDQRDAGLAVVPIAVRNGSIQVAVNVA